MPEGWRSHQPAWISFFGMGGTPTPLVGAWVHLPFGTRLNVNTTAFRLSFTVRGRSSSRPPGTPKAIVRLSPANSYTLNCR